MAARVPPEILNMCARALGNSQSFFNGSEWHAIQNYSREVQGGTSVPKQFTQTKIFTIRRTCSLWRVFLNRVSLSRKIIVAFDCNCQRGCSNQRKAFLLIDSFRRRLWQVISNDRQTVASIRFCWSFLCAFSLMYFWGVLIVELQQWLAAAFVALRTNLPFYGLFAYGIRGNKCLLLLTIMFLGRRRLKRIQAPTKERKQLQPYCVKISRVYHHACKFGGTSFSEFLGWYTVLPLVMCISFYGL